MSLTFFINIQFWSLPKEYPIGQGGRLHDLSEAQWHCYISPPLSASTSSCCTYCATNFESMGLWPVPLCPYQQCQVWEGSKEVPGQGLIPRLLGERSCATWPLGYPLCWLVRAHGSHQGVWASYPVRAPVVCLATRHSTGCLVAPCP